jgi:hypothetical protein
MSSQSPERTMQIERLARAEGLAAVAVSELNTNGQASLGIFDTEDISVNYLAAVLFSDAGVATAIKDKELIVSFPELSGAEHIEGYLGAMAILAGAKHIMVEGILDEVPILATPGAPVDALYDRFLNGLAERFLPPEQ